MPGRIHIVQRISIDVSVGVDSGSKSDSVGLHVPADCGIKISEPVLMQPRLAIEDLPRKTQVVGKRSDRGMTTRLVTGRLRSLAGLIYRWFAPLNREIFPL